MIKGKLSRLPVTFKLSKADDSLPHGTIEAIIATEDLDRHGEHMSIKGIETPRKNYKAYYNHSYNGSTDLPIGLIEKLTKSGGELVGRIKLAVNEYPFAAQVYKLVQGGFLDSMSIGFIPKEWDEESLTWTKSEFVEASIVAEPANVQALVTGKGLAQEDADRFVQLEKEFAAEVKKASAGKVKQITEDMQGMSLTDIKAIVQNAKQSIGEIEAIIDGATPTSTAPRKTLIKLRVAGKKASKSTEQVNKAIKIKLRAKPKE